jgi:exopolysaccharide biosynthesis predicted pyruvyltransferase EpsI/glycosyltransferase involved in cell wall biosynthesis
MVNRIAPPDQEKKVCIIIPVYNAEKFLGYCLNSVLSQTYGNWVALLIDDGSTDGSAEICRQYEEMDSRFRVFSKQNGGVSSARNFGLHYAEGDYLEFVDSDDCLAADCLEKQVALAKVYDSPLVIMNMTLVDFNNPEEDHILLNSYWLHQSPCVLSAEKFREKKMRLIWYTALLEGPCGKLYDLRLWSRCNIHFPAELSLGEDFIANLDYYSECSRVVFLNECGYYYNRHVGSGSLSEKYRADLFEIKMYLMDKLEEHLGGRDALTPPELDAFYCYAASNGLTCAEQVVLSSGMGEQQMLDRLREMFGHPLFAESIQRAGYIQEKFSECIDYAKNGELEKFTHCIKGGHAKEQEASAEQASEQMVESGTEERNEQASEQRIESDTERSTEPGAEQNTEQSTGAIQKCRQFASQLFHGMGKRTRKAAAHDGMENAPQHAVRDQGAAKADLEELSEKLQESINGYTWITEQRMTRYEYLGDINALRQQKKAILLATSEHTNLGDSAITLAEQQLLLGQFPEYLQVEISTYEFERKEAYLHSILNEEDILFINGGGNLGDQYPEEEEMHRRIASEFPDHKIVIFPQTVSFSSTEHGMSELEKSAKVYNRHRDLTLFVRDKVSLQFARDHFPKVKSHLMPDVVHVLRSHYAFERSGILICLREDQETKLDARGRDRIADISLKLAGTADYSSNMYHEDVTREIRGLAVRKELMRFAGHQAVITDRLHGMIFSAVTGTPCVVLSSSGHKIREYYNAFFADSNAVFFIGDEIERLEAAVSEAMQVTDAHYPVFEKDPLNRIRSIVEESSVSAGHFEGASQ